MMLEIRIADLARHWWWRCAGSIRIQLVLVVLVLIVLVGSGTGAGDVGIGPFVPVALGNVSHQQWHLCWFTLVFTLTCS